MALSTVKNLVYLDNNATTKTCDMAERVMKDWITSCSNASGSSFLSRASRLLIDQSIQYVEKLCHLPKAEFVVLFTSGASESNCAIIQMAVDAWERNVGTVPHIVSSSVEHKSILECLSSLADTGRLEITLVEPNMYGIIDPEAVGSAIRDTTALVTIMFANNETGAINPIRQIGEIAHQRNVPFHTDAVQIFGKIKVDIPAFNIDALSMSFHKLYGPQGVGMLILRKTFVDGYELRAQISGTQQSGLRGGTENIHGIAGGVAALNWNFRNRSTKNKRLSHLRRLTIAQLSKHIPVVDYKEFYGADDDSDTTGGDADEDGGATASDDNKEPTISGAKKSSPKPAKKTPKKKDKPRERELVILGPPLHDTNAYLPSTLLLSVVDHRKNFCNIKLKKELEKNNIIVSIGSACNTKSDKASHVIEAIRAPAIVRRGILRVSFGDYNDTQDVHKFVKIFIAALKNQ